MLWAMSEKSKDSDKKESLKRNVVNKIAKNGSYLCVMLCFNKKMPEKTIKKLVKDVNKKLERLLNDAMWIIHETLTVFQKKCCGAV